MEYQQQQNRRKETQQNKKNETTHTDTKTRNCKPIEIFKAIKRLIEIRAVWLLINGSCSMAIKLYYINNITIKCSNKFSSCSKRLFFVLCPLSPTLFCSIQRKQANKLCTEKWTDYG